jgi:hypothetical protein
VAGWAIEAGWAAEAGGAEAGADTDICPPSSPGGGHSFLWVQSTAVNVPFVLAFDAGAGTPSHTPNSQNAIPGARGSASASEDEAAGSVVVATDTIAPP